MIANNVVALTKKIRRFRFWQMINSNTFERKLQFLYRRVSMIRRFDSFNFVFASYTINDENFSMWKSFIIHFDSREKRVFIFIVWFKIKCHFVFIWNQNVVIFFVFFKLMRIIRFVWKRRMSTKSSIDRFFVWIKNEKKIDRTLLTNNRQSN